MKIKIIIGSGQTEFDKEYAGLMPDDQVGKFLNFLETQLMNRVEALEIHTTNPYIVNLFNLLLVYNKIPAKDRIYTQGLSVAYEDLEAYYIDEDGNKRDIKARNQDFLDVMMLSNEINVIYNEYDRIIKEYNFKKK